MSTDYASTRIEDRGRIAIQSVLTRWQVGPRRPVFAILPNSQLFCTTSPAPYRLYMSLSYHSFIIADLRCTGVHLQEGIGFYLLRFSIRFDVKVHDDQTFRLENVRSKVFAGVSHAPQKLLGYAEPEAPILIRTTKYPSNPELLFDIAITPTQLAELESIRNGGDLHFKLHLHGETYGSHDPLPAHDDVHVHVNQTEWIKQLKQISFAEIVLFEVHLPPQSSDGEFRVAVDHLRKARDLFLAGHYDEVVGKCRLAIEGYSKVQGDEQQQSSAVTAFCNNRTGMGVMERLLLIRAAVRHYTQLAHHDLTTESVSSLNRADASLILGMTAGLLAHAKTKS